MAFTAACPLLRLAIFALLFQCQHHRVCMEASLLPAPSPWHSLRPKERGQQRSHWTLFPKSRHKHQSLLVCFLHQNHPSHMPAVCPCSRTCHHLIFYRSPFACNGLKLTPSPTSPLKSQMKPQRGSAFFCIVRCLIQTQFN